MSAKLLLATKHKSGSSEGLSMQSHLLQQRKQFFSTTKYSLFSSGMLKHQADMMLTTYEHTSISTHDGGGEGGGGH